MFSNLHEDRPTSEEDTCTAQQLKNVRREYDTIPNERSGRGVDALAATVQEERITNIVEGLGGVYVGGGPCDFKVER